MSYKNSFIINSGYGAGCLLMEQQNVLIAEHFVVNKYTHVTHFLTFEVMAILKEHLLPHS